MQASQSGDGPELYREYSNPRLHSRTVAVFVLHLVRRPKLAKYVKKIDLKGWETLDGLTPDDYVANEAMSGIRTTREEKIVMFDQFRTPEPTEEEYSLLTAAGIATGIIKEALPYETESAIIQKARPMLSSDIADSSLWFTEILGDDVTFQDVPYDRKFCQLLRAGIDDAYVVLLLALLPHLSEVFLRGAEKDPTALGLPHPLHKFKALRTLKIGCMDMQEAWGIDYLENVLAHAPLEALYLHNASSWCQQDSDNLHQPVTLKLRPASLHLTKLELDNCALRKSDMQTLLNATKSLRFLLYWTGDEDTGLENFTSHELIEMLEPCKGTLEELYLEIVPYWTDFEDQGRLTTLSHFTALRVLDTIPEMWEYLMDEENDYQPIDAEQLFCHRLPPNLETLILHPPRDLEGIRDESMSDVPDSRQVEDVIFKHTELLPHLQDIYIGSAYAEHGYYLDQALQRHRPNFNGLKVTVGIGRARSAPTRSVFDYVLPTFRLPETKWDGVRYSVIRAEKTHGFQTNFPNRTSEDVEAEENYDPELRELEWLRAQDEHLTRRHALAEAGMEDDPVFLQLYAGIDSYRDLDELFSDEDEESDSYSEEEDE